MKNSNLNRADRDLTLFAYDPYFYKTIYLQTRGNGAPLEDNFKSHYLLELFNAITENNFDIANTLINNIRTHNEINKKFGFNALIDLKRDCYNGQTFLMHAVDKGFPEIVKLLLLHSDVNFQNSYGQAALHIAARKNNPEMFKLLVVHGASLTLSEIVYTHSYKLLKTPFDWIKHRLEQLPTTSLVDSEMAEKVKSMASLLPENIENKVKSASTEEELQDYYDNIRPLANKYIEQGFIEDKSLCINKNRYIRENLPKIIDKSNNNLEQECLMLCLHQFMYKVTSKFMKATYQNTHKDKVETNNLYIAIEEFNYDLFKALVLSGADLTRKDEEGKTALDLLNNKILDFKSFSFKNLLSKAPREEIKELVDGAYELCESVLLNLPYNEQRKIRDKLITLAIDLNKNNLSCSERGWEVYNLLKFSFENNVDFSSLYDKLEKVKAMENLLPQNLLALVERATSLEDLVKYKPLAEEYLKQGIDKSCPILQEQNIEIPKHLLEGSLENLGDNGNISSNDFQ